jgi:hypothetical protein
MLKLAGKLEALGELQPEDIPSDPLNRATAVIALHDGRRVTVTGLTREECRKIAPDFGEPFTLSMEGLPC